jgi:hypothetical protein
MQPWVLSFGQVDLFTPILPLVLVVLLDPRHEGTPAMRLLGQWDVSKCGTNRSLKNMYLFIFIFASSLVQLNLFFIMTLTWSSDHARAGLLGGCKSHDERRPS